MANTAGSRVAGLGIDVIDAVVVGDHDPVEVHRALQPAGDQIPVGVHVDPVAEPVLGEVDVGVRRHHGAHVVLAHGGHVRREREPLERGMTDLVNALVDGIVAGRLVVGSGAVGGQAVAGEVLGGGHDAVGIREVPGRALEAVDRGLHHLHEAGVLAEGLIGAAPAVVARDADAGGEDPLRSGRPRLLGGDVLYVVHQPWVTAGAQADVMREDRCAVHVPVAVHGVDAVEDGDVQPCGQRRPLIAVDHVRPRRRGVGRRHRAAARQQASEIVRGDLRRVGVHAGALGLGHLTDLLGQRHPRQQVLNPLTDR